jgi:hypothetical protein
VRERVGEKKESLGGVRNIMKRKASSVQVAYKLGGVLVSCS